MCPIWENACRWVSFAVYFSFSARHNCSKAFVHTPAATETTNCLQIFVWQSFCEASKGKFNSLPLSLRETKMLFFIVSLHNAKNSQNYWIQRKQIRNDFWRNPIGANKISKFTAFTLPSNTIKLRWIKRSDGAWPWNQMIRLKDCFLGNVKLLLAGKREAFYDIVSFALASPANEWF